MVKTTDISINYKRSDVNYKWSANDLSTTLKTPVLCRIGSQTVQMRRTCRCNVNTVLRRDAQLVLARPINTVQILSPSRFRTLHTLVCYLHVPLNFEQKVYLFNLSLRQNNTLRMLTTYSENRHYCKFMLI